MCDSQYMKFGLSGSNMVENISIQMKSLGNTGFYEILRILCWTICVIFDIINTRCLGSWFISCLWVIYCHFTNRFIISPHI
jgi:hypothetical protein